MPTVRSEWRGTTLLSAGQLFSGSQTVKTLDKWTVNVIIQQCDFQSAYLCGTMEAVNVPNEKASVLTFWEGEIIDELPKFWTRQWNATRKTDTAHWSRFPSFASLRAQLDMLSTAIHSVPSSSVVSSPSVPFHIHATASSPLSTTVNPMLSYSPPTGQAAGHHSIPGSSAQTASFASSPPPVSTPVAVPGAVPVPGHSPYAGLFASTSQPVLATPIGSLTEPPTADLLRRRHIFMRWKEKFFIKEGAESRITIAGFYYICFDRVTGTIDGYYFDPQSSPFQQLHLEWSSQGLRGHAFADYAFN